CVFAPITEKGVFRDALLGRCARGGSAPAKAGIWGGRAFGFRHLSVRVTIWDAELGSAWLVLRSVRARVMIGGRVVGCSGRVACRAASVTSSECATTPCSPSFALARRSLRR